MQFLTLASLTNATSEFQRFDLKLNHEVDLSFGMLNSLPNDTFLDWSKLKAFAVDKINVIEKLFVLERVENIVKKGENAGYQHFLLFPQCFQKGTVF